MLRELSGLLSFFLYFGFLPLLACRIGISMKEDISGVCWVCLSFYLFVSVLERETGNGYRYFSSSLSCILSVPWLNSTLLPGLSNSLAEDISHF